MKKETTSDSIPILAARIAGTTATYYIAGNLALSLAVPPGYAAAVWPAAGVALAGILLFGYRIWPGIFLGSFLVNLMVSFDGADAKTVLLPACIASGAVVQAVLGAFLIRRFAEFPSSLNKIRDIIRMMFMGGPVSCLSGATLGVTNLVIFDRIQWSEFAFNWLTWWTGDTIGALVVIPLVSAWALELEKTEWRTRISVILPICLAGMLTVILFLTVRAEEWENRKLEFVNRTDHLAEALSMNLRSYMDILHSIEGFFNASREVDRTEFRAFTKRVLSRYPGIQALEWIPKVREEERAAYEETARLDGFPDYRIREKNERGEMVPARKKSEYFPVFYLEPYKGNEKALGFDLSSNPVRLDALNRSRDSGEPVASSRIKLVQEKGTQYGVLIFLPVFSSDSKPADVATRRSLLKGFALGVFGIGDMISSSMRPFERRGINMWLYDKTMPDVENPLFVSDGMASEPQVPKTGSGKYSNLSSGNILKFAGREWQVYFSADLGDIPGQYVWEAWAVLTGGLFFTTLLGTFFLVHAGRVVTTERVVIERTAELSLANTELEREIADRIQAEKLHRQSETRIRAVLDNVIDGIVTIDEFGIVESFNPAAESIFGYKADAVIGRNVKILMPEPFHSNHDKYLMNYRTTGIRKILGIGREVSGRRKDGSVFPIDLSVSEMSVGDDRMFVGIIRDITERKDAEEKLKTAKEEAESANRAKSEFVANMSHEIRTPMNAVIGFSDLLSVLVTNKKQKSYLRSIQTAAKSLLTLIGDILDLSKIEAGRLDISVEPVYPHKILHEISQVFGMKIQEKGLDFIEEIDPALPEVLLLDETRVRQILFNLVGNAVKFTEKGFIKVSAQKIHKENEKSRIDLVIAVEDTGIGIPEDQRHLVFESFRQQAGQNARKYGGTGLGLAICKRLIKMMNGVISVKSEQGKGSVFEIALRDVEISSMKPAAESGNVSPASMVFEPALVLVTDDIESNRDLIRESLSRTGLKVIEAENGWESLQIAEEKRPDIIFMDIRMPVMDGYEAVKNLKSNRKTKKIPVIALTASVTLEEKASIKSLGFDGFLFKPVNMTELFTELSKFLKSGETESGKETVEEKAETIASGGDVRDLPGLVKKLESEITPVWKEMQGALEMEEVETFGKQLEELALEHNSTGLASYAGEIVELADIFDVGGIETALRVFPELIAQLKREADNG